MKNIKIAILGLGLLTFGLSSCGTTTGTGSANTESTTNLALLGSWTLSEIDGSNINEDFPNKKPSLTFEPVTKKFTGNSGCNNVFGSFTTNNNAINFGDAASTKMFCEGVKEELFLSSLNKANTYTIANNTLTLLDSDNKVILKMTKN